MDTQDCNGFTIVVPPEYLAALKLFAPKDEVRYYLNGINIEVDATEARLMATDGHRLGLFRVKHGLPLATKRETDIIIPLELLANIKGKSAQHVVITIGSKEPGSSSRPISIWYDGLTVSGKTIDGRYPDHWRVIPKNTSGKAAQFNPTYLADFQKASDILRGKRKDRLCPVISYNGEAAALVDLGDENFIGVLMPLRADKVRTAPPAWVFDWLKPAAAVELQEAA